MAPWSGAKDWPQEAVEAASASMEEWTPWCAGWPVSAARADWEWEGASVAEGPATVAVAAAVAHWSLSFPVAWREEKQLHHWQAWPSQQTRLTRPELQWAKTRALQE